jgi:hypothetical protein
MRRNVIVVTIFGNFDNLCPCASGKTQFPERYSCNGLYKATEDFAALREAFFVYLLIKVYP